MAVLRKNIVAAISASLLLASAVELQQVAEGSTAGDSVSSTARATLQDLKQECRIKTSTHCLKVDLLRALDLLSRAPPFEIFPGVKVSSRGFSDAIWGTTKSLLERNASVDNALRSALTQTVSDYLRSLTLQVSIYNQEALDYVYQQPTYSGRGKKMKFLSIYTVFAVAFALLSALVGKAMTLSVVSLVFSMMTRNAIGLGNAPPNSPPVAYDIVRRPQIHFAHTKSQEDVYEGDHSYPVGYVYPKLGGRSKTDMSSSK